MAVSACFIVLFSGSLLDNGGFCLYYSITVPLLLADSASGFIVLMAASAWLIALLPFVVGGFCLWFIVINGGFCLLVALSLVVGGFCLWVHC
jgi:hypothetical protein